MKLNPVRNLACSPRHALTLVVIAIIGFLAAVCRPTRAHGETEEGPTYDGKSLPVWADEVLALNRIARIMNTNHPEVQAMRAIGTNAIPWLLREMTKKPPLENSDDQAVEAQHIAKLKLPVGSGKSFHQLRARAGFWALGEMAAPAIPTLLALLEQQPEFVPSALAGIGKPALPALEQCLTNAPHFVPPYLLTEIPRVRAVSSCLGGLFVAIDLGRIKKADASYLLPVVRRWAEDTNQDASYWAHGVLREFGEEL